MVQDLLSFLQDEAGATAIEYGLIAALVSVTTIGALTSMGNSLQTMFGSVSNTLSNVSTG
jgi:pilus assembly protein Flp/PilA